MAQLDFLPTILNAYSYADGINANNATSTYFKTGIVGKCKIEFYSSGYDMMFSSGGYFVGNGKAGKGLYCPFGASSQYLTVNNVSTHIMSMNNFKCVIDAEYDNKTEYTLSNIDGTNAQTYTENSAPLNNEWCLMRDGVNFSNSFKGILHKVRIWQNNVLKRDYVSKLNPDTNSWDFFDKVTGTFATKVNDSVLLPYNKHEGEDQVQFLHTTVQPGNIGPEMADYEEVDNLSRSVNGYNSQINTGIYGPCVIQYEMKTAPSSSLGLVKCFPVNPYNSYAYAPFLFGSGLMINYVHMDFTPDAWVTVKISAERDKTIAQVDNNTPVTINESVNNDDEWVIVHKTFQMDYVNLRDIKMWQNGVLVRHFVPIKHKTTGKGYYYDAVTQSVYDWSNTITTNANGNSRHLLTEAKINYYISRRIK